MAGPTLHQLAADLAAGRTSARALTEVCLEAIADPAGEGTRAFVSVARERALAEAEAMDRLRAANAAPSPFAGIPVSIKDLFDIAGEVTRAGSRILADQPAAARDAPAVARLRRAGFVPVGRTNMTEFAFSGLGLNPHYGTPLNPWGRAEGRIPGGSTSGGAVSVADGMAHAALGTDTGGSCRIPAAFTGLVGFKPTAGRTPGEGVVPLSTTLDSIGPIGRSVACCAVVSAVLAGREPGPVPAAAPSVAGLRLAVPDRLFLAGADAEVGRRFETALSRLSAAGARVETVALPELDGIAEINAKGGFAAAEAYAWHRRLIAARRGDYDPRVLVRILRGAEQDAADYLDLIADRRRFIAEVSAKIGGFDALVAPTAPIVPPRLADLVDDADYGRTNALVLRNPSVVNLLDGCAISVPVGPTGAPPVGLMLAALHGRDQALLALAAAAEPIVAAA